eukprot:2025847-Rhodomonas_salina.6
MSLPALAVRPQGLAHQENAASCSVPSVCRCVAHAAAILIARGMPGTGASPMPDSITVLVSAATGRRALSQGLRRAGMGGVRELPPPRPRPGLPSSLPPPFSSSPPLLPFVSSSYPSSPPPPPIPCSRPLSSSPPPRAAGRVLTSWTVTRALLARAGAWFAMA